MARSGRSGGGEKPTAPQLPVVDDQRIQERMDIKDSPIPVRTIIQIEVGDMPVRDVQVAIMQLEKVYANGKHPTFVLPCRNGKLRTDVIFEGAILGLVNKLCEVSPDGQIVLRGGHSDVDIMRLHV